MAEIQDVLDKLEDVLEKIADNKEKIDEVRADVNAPKSVQRVCHHCGGDGIKGAPGSEAPCPDCGGDGIVIMGRITLTAEE